MKQINVILQKWNRIYNKSKIKKNIQHCIIMEGLIKVKK